METFEWMILLMIGAVLLAALARQMRAPFPVFLAVGGATLALFPQAPHWNLDPALALAVFVAPVLLDAAYDTSLRDLRDNWVAIISLVVAAVALTTAAVAVVARFAIPDMPWAVAIALGAIVAPPDAAAATAIIRQIGLPHRVTKILEGEGLLNDASALLIYRLAVSAAMAGSFDLTQVAPTFLLGIVGSLIAGPLLGTIYLRISRRFDDSPSAIILQFCVTFGVWILAERLGLSGILTIVTYAITVAQTAPSRTPARMRVPSYAVWETAVFLLNALAFVMIGLQLRPILERLKPDQRVQYLLFALAVTITIVAVRFAWVMLHNYLERAQIARFGFKPRHGMAPPTFKSGLVISWSGMRGIVTLAAAFGLPNTLPDGQPFPFRDLILLTAFCVVIGTLVVQGLTLRVLIASLRLGDSDPVGQEILRVRAAAYGAALDALKDDESREARALRQEYASLLDQIERTPDASSRELPGDPLRRRAIEAARGKADAMRASGEIGDDAFHAIEEELDWAELSSQA